MRGETTLFMSLTYDYDYFGSPFDDPDADLILRSSPVPPSELGERRFKATQFRVHRIFLIEASPIFKRLLSETTSSQQAELDDQLGITREKYDNLPVLCLSEDRNTLHSLLTAICPTDIASPRTLEATLKTCAAATKYDMSSASALFRTICTRFVPVVNTQNAFRDYVLAFNKGLKDEALDAALRTLSLPQTIETYGEDLYIASGPALYALWRHREKAFKAIVIGIRKCTAEVGDLRGWLSSSESYINHNSCPNLGTTPRELFSRFIWTLVSDVLPMGFPTFLETMSSKGRLQCQSCSRHLQFDLLGLFSFVEQHVNDCINQARPELQMGFYG